MSDKVIVPQRLYDLAEEQGYFNMEGLIAAANELPTSDKDDISPQAMTRRLRARWGQ